MDIKMNKFQTSLACTLLMMGIVIIRSLLHFLEVNYSPPSKGGLVDV